MPTNITIYSISDDIKIVVLIYAVIHKIQELLVDPDDLFMVDGPVVHPGFIHFDKGQEEFFTKHLFIQE